MHELSFATSVMESVLEFIESHQIKNVRQVRLAVGELTCIQDEQLKFCYEAITRKTPLEGSLLEIEPVPAGVKCPHCGYEGAPKYWMDSLAEAPLATLQCPTCGKAAEMIRGHECAIKSIQYDNKEQPKP